MAVCNPGWVYGCHDVKGYGGKVQNVCGCIRPQNVTSTKRVEPPPAPKKVTSTPVLRSRFENVPIRNNKPAAAAPKPELKSRFEGIDVNNFTKQIASNPTVSKIEDVVEKATGMDVQPMLIVGGIAVVVLVVILLIFKR